MKLKNLSDYDSYDHKDSDSIIILVEKIVEAENMNSDFETEWLNIRDIQKEIKKLGYYVDFMDIVETMTEDGWTIKNGKLKL